MIHRSQDNRINLHWWVVFLGSLALSFILYSNTIGRESIYDDTFIFSRQELRDLSVIPQLVIEPYLPRNRRIGVYRPVTLISFAANFIWFGERPESFHIINMVINGLVTFLVYLVVQKLWGNSLLSLATALLFAVLPIHTEAVASIKSRDELLSALFWLLGWYFFLKGIARRQSANKALLVSAAWVLLGSFSKEIAIIAPLTFVAVWWLKDRPPVAAILKMGLWYGPVLLVFVIMRQIALGQDVYGGQATSFIINPLQDAPLITRVWTAGKLFFMYVEKTLVPLKLSATYAYKHLMPVTNPLVSWQSLVGFALMGSLPAIVLYPSARKTPLATGMAVLVLPFLIFSKVVFSPGDIFAERWMYFPSIGISLIISWLILRLYYVSKHISISLFTILILLYTLITINRNQVWSSNQALYESMVRDAPESVQGHLNLANWYFENGDKAKAKSEITIARSIYPNHPPLVNLEGTIAAEEQDYELAEKLFQDTLTIDPNFAQAVSNLGRVYYETGRYQMAEATLWSVIEPLGRYPRGEDVLVYALTLAKLGKYKESLGVIKRYEEAVKLVGSDLPAFIEAVNYYKMGMYDMAKNYYFAVGGETFKEKEAILRRF